MDWKHQPYCCFTYRGFCNIWDLLSVVIQHTWICEASNLPRVWSMLYSSSPCTIMHSEISGKYWKIFESLLAGSSGWKSRAHPGKHQREISMEGDTKEWEGTLAILLEENKQWRWSSSSFEVNDEAPINIRRDSSQAVQLCWALLWATCKEWRGSAS